MRPQRREQLARLKAVALALARERGKTGLVCGTRVIETKLDTLYFWLTPFGAHTNLDIWDETLGGTKVLNMSWGPDGVIDVVNFRRGDWEAVLLARVRQGLH